ncbi:MAG: hypothetical protein M3178_01130 [Pseudomonadota bacterium]|nr:hypothetical protein [Pseudomonadota bacterium]
MPVSTPGAVARLLDALKIRRGWKDIFLKTHGEKNKPSRNLPLAPNPRAASRPTFRADTCPNRQSYQNVSRETFWVCPPLGVTLLSFRFWVKGKE